jgi:hypothetical protein
LQRINVVVVGITGMLNRLVKAALDVPDVRIAADVPLGTDIDLITRHGIADVVIIGADGHPVEQTAYDLLRLKPTLKVLAIRDLGRSASFYEVHTEEVELSKDALLHAVRSARAEQS